MQIVLISGFLGSGKTTFLHHLTQDIQTLQSHKIALVINEFADIVVDTLPHVISSEARNLITITNGSILCTCKTHEFFACIQKLAADGFDYALVETSGFANLKGLQAVVNALSQQLHIVWLDRIVLVDAAKILKWLKVASNARNQIEMATIILINKVDLVNDEQLEEVTQTISELNPQAKTFRTLYGNINLASLLQPSALQSNKPLWLTKNLREAFITIQIAQNCTLSQLEAALTALGDKIFRAKGFMTANDQIWHIDYSGHFTATPVHHAEEIGKLVLLYDIALISRKEIMEVFRILSK